MNTPNTLTGEALVVEYIAYVDHLWITNPAMVHAGYATRLGHHLNDDASQRQGTIADTEGTHPSQWVFRDAFIESLQQEGRYSRATAQEFVAIGAA